MVLVPKVCKNIFHFVKAPPMVVIFAASHKELPVIVSLLPNPVAWKKDAFRYCGTTDIRPFCPFATVMPCGVGHITKNSTNVFSACRKRRLKETGRGDWESPPL